MSGRTVDEMSKSLAKAANVKKSNARRLVLTETAYFSSLGSRDCFNSLNVEKFQILGTLDGTTCSDCGKLDGEVYDMKDFKPGVTAPPFHCNCRCTTIPYFDDKFTQNEKRFARDNDNNAIYVDSNMKFEDWKEKFIHSEKDVDNSVGNGIIRVNKTEIKAKPNSITEVVNKKGGIDRNYYDSEGKQIKQISNNNHGKPKQHPFGKNGEHAHDYIWENGNLIGRPARELTDIERKENGDIL